MKHQNYCGEVLEGRVVAVTGAAKRVGRAIALGCARAGADVAIHYRSSVAEAEHTAAEVRDLGRRAELVCADLTSAEDVAALVEQVSERFGGLDVLVNSAASFVHCDYLQSTDADWEAAWRTSFETNLLGPARLIRAAAPLLAASGGVVVNIVDVGASLAWPGYAQHTACKAGLAHLTRTLAVALAPKVRVVGVAPGIAEFPEDYSEQAKARAIAATALKRAGTGDDIAQAVVFLATQAYTTGTIVTVDGGWSIAR